MFINHLSCIKFDLNFHFILGSNSYWNKKAFGAEENEAPKELSKVEKIKTSIRKLQNSVQPKNSTEIFEFHKINNSINVLEQNIKDNEILTGDVEEKIEEIRKRVKKYFPAHAEGNWNNALISRIGCKFSFKIFIKIHSRKTHN